jgi:hypothetical protein
MVTLLQHSDLHGTQDNSRLDGGFAMNPFLVELILVEQFCRYRAIITDKNAVSWGDTVSKVNTDSDVSPRIY